MKSPFRPNRMRQLSQMKKHTKERTALLHFLQEEKASIIRNTLSRHIVIDEPGDVIHQTRLLAYLELYREGKLELSVQATLTDRAAPT